MCWNLSHFWQEKKKLIKNDCSYIQLYVFCSFHLYYLLYCLSMCYWLCFILLVCSSHILYIDITKKVIWKTIKEMKYDDIYIFLNSEVKLKFIFIFHLFTSSLQRNKCKCFIVLIAWYVPCTQRTHMAGSQQRAKGTQWSC